MAVKNLQQALDAAGNPVEMLRNSQMGAYVYPVVPSEFTNWRDEQHAWRHGVVLFDQTHHMANLYVEGPDAVKMVSYLSTNSYEKFPVDRAKQFAPTSYSGHVIGDGILFHLEQNKLVFVGRAPAANWMQFHGESGKFDVKVTMDDRSPMRPMGKAVTRSVWRFQIQGAKAEDLLQKLHGGSYGEIKFFNMGSIKIKGKTVRALRHGMAGTPGLELWGPYEEQDEMRAAILEAGKALGLKPRIHADELAASGGPAVAARVGARSADHLVQVDAEGIRTLASAGVVATLLPCAAFYLKLGRFAPARDLITAGVPVALATDVNAGGGLSPSMPFAMTLACFGMMMTFEEALAAATLNGAYSLDRHDRVGSLEPGKQFDAVLVDGPAASLLRINASPIRAVYKKGTEVHARQ